MLGVIFLIGCFLYPFVMLFGACILEILAYLVMGLAYLVMGVSNFFIWILKSMGSYEDKNDEEDIEYYFEELEQLKLETIKKVKEKM